MVIIAHNKKRRNVVEFWLQNVFVYYSRIFDSIFNLYNIFKKSSVKLYEEILLFFKWKISLTTYMDNKNKNCNFILLKISIIFFNIYFLNLLCKSI